MKIREGFVSNSSSSSFVIKKSSLTAEQIKLIKKHVDWDKYAVESQMVLDGKGRTYDEWDIQEDEEFITGGTFMDNFPMDEFLEAIGVDSKDIAWGTK